MNFHEFKPTIFFLVKFVGLYIVGNVLYGLYITAYEPSPDPVTHEVTVQSGKVLNACGYDVTVENYSLKPTTQVFYNGKAILAVYEGCNGLNIMIIFVSFIVAFGPYKKPMLWFIPLGLLIIHIANLGRIVLLFLVSEFIPKAMYFTHKYFFTAILYVVIFLLWWWWIKRFATVKAEEIPNHQAHDDEANQ